MRKIHVSTFSLNSFLRPLLLLVLLCTGYKGNTQPLSGILPKYGAYIDQTTVNFSWNSKEGTIDYTIVVAQDIAFSIGVSQSPLLSTTSWISSPLSSGIWYWKVVANDGFETTESGINFFGIFKPTDLTNNTL